jgi:glutamate-ammonia-ligase adenylyltransferase
MVAERQTHSLPADPAERARLARRAGLPDAAALDQELELRRAQVQARFDDLLRVAGGGPPPVDDRAATALDAHASESDQLGALASLGFFDPETAAAELARMARKRGSPFSAASPPSLQQAGPALLAEVGATPDPDQALRHLADLFGVLAAPAQTAEVLANSPRTARLLLSLFGSSDFLSRSLLRDPELIDELLRHGSAPMHRPLPELRSELQARLGPREAEQALAELRRFHNEEILRIGLHDIAGALDVEQVTGQLSDLADAAVEACLQLAERETLLRDGPPRHPDGTPATLVVVGLGKLGGRELGYHSDLDLLFLYSGPGETAGGQRGPAPNHEHFARVAQRMISHLTLRLREGSLYRIDTRLRPSGSAGPLVVSFDALAGYHQKLARTWERQALLRARAVAGDAALFERARREVLEPALFRALDDRARAEVARELLSMRERIEREIAAESPQQSNVKLGRGGLVDVEFAVQYLLLVSGAAHPAIRIQSTPQALAACVSTGLLSPEGGAALAQGYRFLRRLESRLRIVRDRPSDLLPRSGRELSLLARRLGYAGARAGHALLDDHRRATEAVHAAFLEVLGAEGGAA